MDYMVGDSQVKKLLDLGIRKYEEDNYTEALEAFNNASNLDDCNADVLKWLGNTKRLLNNLDGALADLCRAVKLRPNDAFAISRRGEVRRLLGNHKQARRDFDKACKLKPDDVWILQGRGWLKKETNDLKGALKDFNKANRLQRSNEVTLRKRGNVKRLLKDYAGALKDLNKALKLKPDNAYTLRYRGDVKQNLGDFKGALEDLNRADQLRPDDALTLQIRGVTKRHLNDYKGALVDLNRSDELEPQNAYTLQFKGDTKRMLRDFHGALEDFDKADQLQPKNVFILACRASTKQMLYDYDGALEDLSLADSSKPYDPFTIVTRALIHYSMNKMIDAYADFSLYDELVPNNNEYTAQKTIVENAICDGIPLRKLIVISQLGFGGYGEVYLAELNGKQIAYKKSRVCDSSTVLEAVTILRFKHENIISSWGFCKIDNGEIILVMEYAKDGSLADLLYKQNQKLKHASILLLAHDIASGLAHLHRRNVIHRDLKSANILLFDNKTRAKITDFGQSRFLNEKSVAHTVAGTTCFMAPEVLAEDCYNASADIYSFGVLLYEMCTNSVLPILDEKGRMNKISASNPNTGLKELIMMCCRTDPSHRPTIHECLDKISNMFK